MEMWEAEVHVVVLLEAMHETAIEALTELGVSEEARAIGFMTPPYNTQYQLHMHALERPITAKGMRGSAFDLKISPIFKSFRLLFSRLYDLRCWNPCYLLCQFK